jgi:hypothetical protein
MTEVWPWFAVAGLGMFHGVNPAMGWLFAVALGLHRRSRAVVPIALVPIAVGHAAAVAMITFSVIALGMFIDEGTIRMAAGGVLIAWAIYHRLFAPRHRVRFGMQVGMIGLAVWSLLMATAHGAGLMLVPVLIPLCLSATPVQELTASGSLPIALAVVGVHTLSMLATTCLIAVVVYECFGVAFLRRGWINLDLIWTMALLMTGLILVAI